MGPETRIAGSGWTRISGSGRTRTVRPKRWIWAVGDSKTAGDEWLGYLPLLTTPSPWLIVDGGVPGRTVQTVVDNLAALLVTTAGLIQEPTVLINLGANDVGALPVDTVWMANYLTIVDAVVARWPGARVYIMRPWRRGFNTECDTVATWITALVTARPNSIYLGPDERVWFQGADDGVTLSLDGVHYNMAGETACAAAWAAVLWP